MKLQIFAPHFAPDNAPTGTVMTAIVEGLAELGHTMEVITSLPWYSDHQIEPEWSGKLHRVERTAWGQIRRLHPFPTDKSNIRARALAFGGFTALTGTAGVTSRFAPDAVLAMSPPITLGYAGWASAKRHRVPFVFNIQDVFPDVAVELGVLTGERSIALFSRLERQLYGMADAVTVLSEDLRDNVAAKVDPSGRDKVRVIPNFVDTEAIEATSAGDPTNTYRQEFGLVDKTVVMYAGNIGFSQSIELVLGAAEELQRMGGYDDVVFVINGNGSARPAFEADAAERGLTNVRFVDYQPVERLSEVLAAGDLHLVPLKRGLARSSVPSKFYSILAASRPVLASVDPDTELDRLVTNIGCGAAVVPDDQGGFTQSLVELLANADRRVAQGEAGRSFVEGWISPLGVAQSYEELFDELRASH